jgi:hypothetical protein
MALDPSEAEQYGVAVRDVARHYKITNKFVGKWADWINLIGVLAVIYGPRMYMIRQRVQADDLERRARVTPAPRPAPPTPSPSASAPAQGPQAAPPTAVSPSSPQSAAPGLHPQSPNGASTKAMPIPPLQAIDLAAFEEANASPESREALRRLQIKESQGRH